MPSNKDLRPRLFAEMAADLGNLQPGATDEILCPLCLRRFGAEALQDDSLSVEHIIPSALGGTSKTTTITCRKQCNNDQGSALDSHLVNAMQGLDALSGDGLVKGKFHDHRGGISINLGLPSGQPDDLMQIHVVRKANNPADLAALPKRLFHGATFTLSFTLGLIPEHYWRGVFRAAYLAVFKSFGYSYVLSEGGAQVRRVLDGESPDNRVILQAFVNGNILVPFVIFRVVMPTTGSFFLVLLKIRSGVTRYITALLPGPDGCAWDRLAALVEDPSKLVLRVTPAGAESEFVFRFDKEPFQRLRESNPSTDPANSGP